MNRGDVTVLQGPLQSSKQRLHASLGYSSPPQGWASFRGLQLSTRKRGELVKEREKRGYSHIYNDIDMVGRWMRQTHVGYVLKMNLFLLLLVHTSMDPECFRECLPQQPKTRGAHVTSVNYRTLPSPPVFDFRFFQHLPFTSLHERQLLGSPSSHRVGVSLIGHSSLTSSAFRTQMDWDSR